MSSSSTPKFGTFTGVFTPTLLTILGVIMYVRLGWVVGNAGLGWAWAMMGLAMGITACTGLSLSSVATNTRIGHGGPYAIIARSLGLEVGGSIGVPLYLSRPLGVAMYVFGFREGWQWIFPSHNALVIDLVVFGLLFGIAYRSAGFAFRIQFVIMGVIAASLVSIFAAVPQPPIAVTWIGEYPGFPETGLQGTDFWEVFAVFFPATTGILAGANMSGDLQDPRRAIPVGTLSAIGLSSVFYFGLAWWCARSGTPEELVTNYNFIIDNALFGPVVLAGLLGATFSSALAGLVGGPRILMAMGQHRIIPMSDWMAETSPDGEPRNAMLLTGVLSLAAVMVRDLNTIAPLITMFFLLTYAVINLVVLVEGGLGLVSFRPTLRVPLAVPLFGLAGSVFAMFVVNPTFALVSVVMVVAVYAMVQRRIANNGIESSEEDVRSSIFVALAEWAAAQVNQMPHSATRAWKPNLLVPVEDPEQLSGEFQILLDVVRPEGSIKLLGLATGSTTVGALEPRLKRLATAFGKADLFCTWSIVNSADFGTATIAGLQALQSAFFRPNVLFLSPPTGEDGHFVHRQVMEQAQATGVGVLYLQMHQRAGVGQREVINLWVRRAPNSWDPTDAFSSGNLNLNLLMGYRLMRIWKAELNVITVVPEGGEIDKARAFLDEMMDLARFGSNVRRVVLEGDFETCLRSAPVADVQIMGLAPSPDFGYLAELSNISRSTCLFVLDSGRESALA